MDKNTFIESIKEIGSCEDGVERLNKLTNLQDKISKVFDDKTGLESEVQTLKDSIVKKDEEIQKANKYAMDMFLKVGEQKSDSKIQEEKTGIKQEEEKTYRSYEEIAKDFM